MLKVGLDISALDPGFKVHATRGIGRYVGELNRFFEQHPDPEIKIGRFDHRMLTTGGYADQLIDKLPLGRNTVRQQLLYPFRLNQESTKQFDFLHFPAHMDAPSWSVKRYIITVLDLIPLVLSDLYKPEKIGFKFRLARWLEIRAIKNATLILAISENTARDVHDFLGVPYERIVVTPLGVDPSFQNVALAQWDEHSRRALCIRYKIPFDRQAILYVGGIDQRKNMRSMITSYKILKQRFLDNSKIPPVLLLVGGIEKDREYPRLRALISEHELEGDVFALGYVDDTELKKLYRLSSVFFFPSLYEGFGLPPLEAMAAGTPVVSSNRSSMPEVLGNSACLVNPENYEECAEALQVVLENREYALELRDAGLKQSKKFTWAKTGELTLDAYRLLAGSSLSAQLAA